VGGDGGGAGVAGSSLNTRRRREEQRSRSDERKWLRSRGSRIQSKHKEEVRGAEEQEQ